MRTLALIVLFLPLSVSAQTLAQDFPVFETTTSCFSPKNKDWWKLEKHPENADEYLFTYSNSLSKCSVAYAENGKVVEAEDGFKVTMYVHLSYNGTTDEYIYVVPHNLQYMSYPPEIVAPDSSEPYTIRIFAGVS